MTLLLERPPTSSRQEHEADSGSATGRADPRRWPRSNTPDYSLFQPKLTETPLVGSEETARLRLTPDTTESEALSTPAVDHFPVERDRVSGLVQYLVKLSKGKPTERRISPEVARTAIEAWARLWIAAGRKLAVPDACPTPDDGILLTWDRDEHHFEVEVLPQGPPELFYENLESGEMLGHDWQLDQPLPPGVLAKLAIMV